MAEHDLALGGEQSGHIVFARPRDHRRRRAHRADRRAISSRAGRPLSTLAAAMTRLPAGARERARRARGRPRRTRRGAAAAVARGRGRARRPTGRVLVRPSGTEPVVRVMVEAPTAERGRARPCRPRSSPLVAAAGRMRRGRPDAPRACRSMCGHRRASCGAHRGGAPPDLAPLLPTLLDAASRARSPSSASPRPTPIALPRRPRPRVRRRRRARCAGPLGVGALLGDPRRRWPRSSTGPTRSPRTLGAIEAHARRRGRDRRRRRRGRRGPQRRARRVQGRGLGDRAATGSAPPARSTISPGGGPHRPRRSTRSTRSRSRCRRSTGSRCAAATRPGLHLLVTGHGLDLADPDVARLIAERGADPLFAAGVGARRRRARSRSSTRPRPRSVSSATTPRALRAQIRDDELLRLALRVATRRGRGARAHALGERRHHLRSRTRTR